MTLYHGSYLAVEMPNISYSREKVDFGKGFYTTQIKEQAVRWSARFKRKKGQCVVSLYEIDKSELLNNSKILSFETYSDEWLDFILDCRRGNDTSDYDVVIGGVANDKVFDTIELFFEKLIDRAEAIERLRYESPNLQYCFRSQDIIDRYLKFVSSEEV
ncbi:MAG: DUF3990 domain-containing protein [Oscillospiraceae bacterium]|nr:DUF3990 domain-containing protein [Oscillospiraceae bacterium]